MQKIFFIADLHLSPEQPLIAEIFLRFLAECPARAQALYILGDFFEAWIGDDQPEAFYLTIQAALYKATQQGLSIYVQHGNRDFLLGKNFFAATGCQQLSDYHVVDIFAHKVLLMHGDLLCTHDHRYQRMRYWFHKRWLQTLFLSLPLKWRLGIARKMRQTSHNYTQNAKDIIMDVAQETVNATLQCYGTDYLIHGHTHRPDVHNFILPNGKACQRIVMAAWHTAGNVFVWQADNKRYFESLS